MQLGAGLLTRIVSKPDHFQSSEGLLIRHVFDLVFYLMVILWRIWQLIWDLGEWFPITGIRTSLALLNLSMFVSYLSVDNSRQTYFSTTRSRKLVRVKKSIKRWVEWTLASKTNAKLAPVRGILYTLIRTYYLILYVWICAKRGTK